MNKFKISILGKPRFSLNPETKTTTCRINYDVTGLENYIATIAFDRQREFCKLIAQPVRPWPSKVERQNLGYFVKGVVSTIVNNLVDTHKIHTQSIGRHNTILYVEGVAKFNPTDTDFDKQKGRDIAWNRARLELLKVEGLILKEMSDMSALLHNCWMWHQAEMPNSLQDRMVRGVEKLHEAINDKK